MAPNDEIPVISNIYIGNAPFDAGSKQIQRLLLVRADTRNHYSGALDR
jgi:hypothetical protein